MTFDAAARAMRLAVLAILVSALCGACATTRYPTPAPVVWTVNVPEADVEAIQAQPVISRSDGRITLLPISPTGAVIGTDYGYAMPHCGIGSPIDVDGSFWDAVILPPDPVQFDGVPGTFRLTARDVATFTDASGAVLHLARHQGPKEFGYCA